MHIHRAPKVILHGGKLLCLHLIICVDDWIDRQLFLRFQREVSQEHFDRPFCWDQFWPCQVNHLQYFRAFLVRILFLKKPFIQTLQVRSHTLQPHVLFLIFFLKYSGKRLHIRTRYPFLQISLHRKIKRVRLPRLTLDHLAPRNHLMSGVIFDDCGCANFYVLLQFKILMLPDHHMVGGFEEGGWRFGAYELGYYEVVLAD